MLSEVVGSTPTRSTFFCCTTMVLFWNWFRWLSDKFSNNLWWRGCQLPPPAPPPCCSCPMVLLLLLLLLLLLMLLLPITDDGDSGDSAGISDWVTAIVTTVMPTMTIAARMIVLFILHPVSSFSCISTSCCRTSYFSSPLLAKYNTTFSISISVTNLWVSSMCIASSSCLWFDFKTSLTCLHLLEHFGESVFLIPSVSL